MSNILTNLARHGAEIYGADREVFARIDLDRPGGAGTEPRRGAISAPMSTPLPMLSRP